MLNKFKKIYTNSRIARFGFYGSINTLLGFITYPILYFYFNQTLSYMEILYISFFICTHYAFLTTKYYVFKSNESFMSEYFRYMMFHFLMLAINSLYLPVFVEILSIHPSVSQIIFNFILISVSYLWHLKVTSKPKV